MEWFERWFGEEYLLVYEHRDIREAEHEAERIIDFLNLRSGELVLDLCCGPGRHDGPFARRGCRIVGLDFSMPMIKIARDAVPPESPFPWYVRGDARMLPFDAGTFDAVLNLFTSFGYFEDGKNHALIRSIGTILRPGGRFYIDYLNPAKVRAGLLPETTQVKEGVTVTERRRIDEGSQRVEKEIELHWDNHSRIFHESVRLYPKEDMLAMIDDAGLETLGILGSTAGESFTDAADRMILFGRKR